ncbi:MAG: FtsX-like permease family protein [Nanoarchaeota archaeon]
MIKDYFSIALRNIRNRKLRSWLTILGIIISISVIFMLISVSLGLENAVKEQFRILGTDKFFILPKGQIAGPGTLSTVILNEKDTETIEKVQGVKDISYLSLRTVEVVFNNQKKFFSAIGMPEGKSKVYREIEAYKEEEGKEIKDEDRGEIMLGSQYKHNFLFETPIKTRDKVKINGKEFKVKAILKPIGNPGDDQIIYMNLRDLKEIVNVSGIDQIIVQIDEGEDINEVIQRTGRKLQSVRGVNEDTKDFIILSPEELLSDFSSILNIITGFLFGVAAISILVGGIGIANTMFTSVLERTREIGTMKAVGAKNSDILLIFLIESGLLGLTGGIFGVILGYMFSKVIKYLAINKLGTTLLVPLSHPLLIMGCLFFAFFIGVVSGIWPAWRASKLKAVDALRYE